jgi:NADH-quinone oxidoreductase subunit L
VISEYAWLIPAAPALSAAIITFFGKQFPKRGAEVGIVSVAMAFALSVWLAIEVWGHNAAAARHEGSAFLLDRAITLTPIGGDFTIELAMRIDGLVAMMFLLVTFVSLMVHIYSSGYMRGDSRFTWFFGVLSLFTFSMLLLVIAGDLMILLIGWELVGVCSYLLIGFWWEEKKNSDAAVKAFLTTKLGDVGLIVGIVTLWGQFQTFRIGEIIAAVQGGDYSQGMLTFGLIALFVGAVGKSAQFPLHTWLPDAMAGPTPVSALIHAATMVTAGVFLVARLYPLYSASPAAKGTVAIIGAITLFAAGLLALVQDDLKRVLAYSTVSQLGYMVAALAFSYTAGIFHLFTHGFFKALLFLGAGSVIHAAHSNNMTDMGGLKRFMPVTFWTFLIGSLALLAAPPLAGFWSKDEILVEAFNAGGYFGMNVFTLGILGGLVTAFYMTRALYLTFAGQFRGHGEPHESERLMTAPLVALAVPSVAIGLINLPFGFVQEVGAFSAWTMFSIDYWVTHPVEFNAPIAAAATVLALIGVVAGRAIYRTYPERDPLLHMGIATRVLENRYYLDHLYTDLIVRTTFRDKLARAAYWSNERILDRAVYLSGVGARRLALRLYDVGDQRGIDGAVNGLGLSAMWSAARVRLAQSGNVQLYAGAMFVGVFVLAIAFATAS